MARGKFILQCDWLRGSRAGESILVESGSRSSSAAGTHGRWRRADGQLPIVGRVFPAPLALKVPEIIFLFWVVKILTTAGGEVTSDYLKKYGNFGGGGTEVALFVFALLLQFTTRRYRALAYWSLAYAIAIAGTGLSDFLHLDVHIPYAGTSLMWAVILAIVFRVWYRSEGTLSIHSVATQRREAFYWATVFVTFALGTAVGDFTADTLNMGYLVSGFFFLGVILIPAIGWRWFGLNSIVAFWFAYIVTRQLGASFSDWISKPADLTGLNFGNGRTAIVFGVVTFAFVVYLAVARPDVKSEGEQVVGLQSEGRPGGEQVVGLQSEGRPGGEQPEGEPGTEQREGAPGIQLRPGPAAGVDYSAGALDVESE
jgi:uncharacterized membrane-anchored protein